MARQFYNISQESVFVWLRQARHGEPGRGKGQGGARVLSARGLVGASSLLGPCRVTGTCRGKRVWEPRPEQACSGDGA